MRETLVRSVLSVDLVFGLDWQPLISGRASSAARRVARQRKASHIVLDGKSPASFGYGALRPRSGTRRQALHSAAQNLARLHPTGSVACLISLDTAGYWVAGVHEGAVMARTDVIHRSIDEARQALEALRRAHPRLKVLCAAGDVPGLPDLARVSDSGTLLRDSGRRRRQWLLRVVLLLLTGALLAATHRVWTPRTAKTAEPALDAAEVQSRWRKAVSDAEQRINLHGVAATHAVLRHIYGIPARLSGWTLARVSCLAEGSLWRCVADFDRRHPHADNEGLLKNAPPAWQLSFPTMDRASAAWELQTLTHAAGPRHVDTVSHNRRYLQSAWQGMRPAFNAMALGASSPVDMSPPTDDEGRPLPRPQGLPRYVRSPVQFEGPLRSASLLLPHTRSIGWRSLTLVLGAPTPAALASSRLRITLHGDLYELLEADES